MHKLSKNITLALFAVYHAVVIYFARIPGSELAAVTVGDKALHIAEFFGLGVLTFLFFLQRTSVLRRYLIYLRLIFWGLFMATLTETIQINIPGRVADPLDFAANTFGLLTAFIICFTVHIILREKKIIPTETQ